MDPIPHWADGDDAEVVYNILIDVIDRVNLYAGGKADTVHSHAAGDIVFTPSGNLEATTVAAALVELDSEKLAKAGGTMTGPLLLAADPSSAYHAATKQYVDALALNLGKRGRVRAATTGNVTIATALNNGDAIDGVTLVTGDLVLVRAQTAPAENGVYVVGATPVRFAEYDSFDEHPGALLAVAEGSTLADTMWLCVSNGGGTLGSTAIDFAQQRVTGELLAANNLSDLANPATARVNLGLVIGTHVQAYNANLAAFAGLSLIADRYIYANGTGTLALGTITAFGRSLVDDADGAAGCATLGAARLAGATFTGDLVAGGSSSWPFKVRYNNGASGIDVGIDISGEVVIKGSLNNTLIVRGLGNSAGEGILFQRDPGDGGAPTDLFKASPALLAVNGQVSPTADNIYTCGNGTNRFSVFYGGTSVIATSDAREKLWLGGLTPAERAAARRILSRVGAYRWLDAIARKGEAARRHIGVLAQDVAADMQVEGLDPAAYGFWCCDVLMTTEQRVETYDEVEPVTESVAVQRIEVRDGVPRLIEVTEHHPVVDMVAVVDVSGAAILGADGAPLAHPVPRTRTVTREKTVTVEVPLLDQGGEPVVRYGIRYDELAMFLFAAMAEKLAALEAAA